MRKKLIKQASVAANLQSAHGECPTWDSYRKRLLSVDLTQHKIHAFYPKTRIVETKIFEEPVCALGPYPDGRIIVAFAKRLAWLDWDSDQITHICDVEPEKPNNRCNDGKLDPSGRFWIGTMSADGSTKGAGALYRLDNNQLARILDHLTIANGLGWSSDHQTMFFIDSPTREICAFNFNPNDSSIHNPRCAIRIPENLGIPDGMCVGPDNSLWVAIWGGNCVTRWAPNSGELLEQINTACPHTTSCDFDDAGTLYITTSQLGLNPKALSKAPHSGDLFSVTPSILQR